MVSILHEALVQFFRKEPGVLADVLWRAFDVRLPDEAPTVLESTLNQLSPTEYQADLVIAIGDGVGVILEVQLHRDDDKEFTWPVYLANLRARERCRVYLLVVTPSEAVAKWAARTIELGQPGFNLTPFVLGPGSFRSITDPEEAKAKPELAILTTLLHAEKLDFVEVKGALLAAGRLDPARETMYVDLILQVVEKAAPQILEAVMSISPDGYEFKSEFALKYLRQGREEGRAEAILSVLDERGLQVLEAQREAILAFTDRAALDQLLRLALTTSSTKELLQAVPPASTKGS